MTALYLTRDLFFSSRVISAATACGLDLCVVADASQLMSKIEGGGVDLVLFDLTTTDLDLTALVPRIRNEVATPVSVIAFGPVGFTLLAVSYVSRRGCA